VISGHQQQKGPEIDETDFGPFMFLVLLRGILEAVPHDEEQFALREA
jgi:hypothetical protein